MRVKLILIVMLSLGLIQCATYDFSRRTVQQGNLLPEKKLKRLKLGMTKREVAILMGNSLLSPIFNDNRWDYAYTIRHGNGRTIVKNVSIYFKYGKVSSIK